MRMVLTPGGRRRLTERLAAVRAELDAIVADMPAALESGDTSGWHDNFAFEDNQRRQHQLAHRLRELERILDQAELISPWTRPPDRAWVGARVRYQDPDDPADEPRTVWLAGFGDGDPACGRISYDSPLGRALLGAAEGEVRTVHVGGVARSLEVLELGPTPAGEER